MTDTTDLDQLVADLGDPVTVETTGPAASVNGLQDLPDHLADLGAIEGIGPATLAKVTPADDLVRTIRGAIEWAREQVKQRVAIYHGLCLMFVRLCFNVDALYPDAITAWENSERRHPCSSDKARRGHAGFFRGGAHGHVVLCLGRGLCISTDVKVAGQASVCRIDDIEAAWGYQFLGDVSQLNGEVAPRPKPTRRRIGSRAWRSTYLRKAIVRARANGNPQLARRLRDWRDDIARREAGRR